MLASWRPTRKPSQPALHQPPDPAPHSPQQADAEDAPSARPSLDRAVPAPLSTPHDAALSELLGRRDSTSQERASPPDAARQAVPKISIDGTASSFYRSERTATPSPAALRSATASPSAAAHEPVYDPFTGALAGVLVGPPAPDREGSHAMADADVDQTRDELWAHLSRIRELQSGIASMHLQMEGIGSGDGRSARRAAGATRGATEEWDEPGEAEAEAQRKAARDAEFATLAETFRGRRAAIDGIMGKLDDLSQALTTFHALPTPVMHFATSRSTTNQSRPQPPPRSTPVPDQRARTPTAVLQDESEREPVFPESPASDAPPHVAGL